MSEGLNKVILIGNIGQTPELRHTTASSVLTIRMATTESFLGKDKERKEKTEWHTVVVWGKRAESLAKLLDKGSKIGVEGRLQTESWEADDGSKRYATKIVADKVFLLGGGDKSQTESRTPEAPEQPLADDFPF